MSAAALMGHCVFLLASLHFSDLTRYSTFDGTVLFCGIFCWTGNQLVALVGGVKMALLFLAFSLALSLMVSLELSLVVSRLHLMFIFRRSTHRPVRGRLAQKMLFVGKVVRVLRQARPSSVITKNKANVDGNDSDDDDDGGDRGDGDCDDENSGDDGDGGVGVSEAEVLGLTRRWCQLRDRETFHLLALERAVHEVRLLQ